MNRPQLSRFCPHVFRPFRIGKLRRSHCSTFPVSEEVFANKKASFLSPVAHNGYVSIPSFCSYQPQIPTWQETFRIGNAWHERRFNDVNGRRLREKKMICPRRVAQDSLNLRNDCAPTDKIDGGGKQRLFCHRFESARHPLPPHLTPSCKNLVQPLSARTFHLVLTIPSLQLFCFWNTDVLFAGNRPCEGSARKGDGPYFIQIFGFGAHQRHFRRGASNIQHERALVSLNLSAEISC
jgi:hypothetical protein